MKLKTTISIRVENEEEDTDTKNSQAFCWDSDPSAGQANYLWCLGVHLGCLLDALHASGCIIPGDSVQEVVNALQSGIDDHAACERKKLR